jgi:hypothetical protein
MSVRAVLALAAVAISMMMAGVASATAPGAAAPAVQAGEAWGAVVVAHAVADQQQPPRQKHPKVDFTQTCVECHTRRTPQSTEAWVQSAHSPNVGCFICHGDAETDFVAKPDNTSCMTCHAAKAAAMERAQVPTCFTCHDGHRLKFHID